MTPTDLFLALTNRGFTLAADGTALLVTPRGQLTAAETAAIKVHKNGLLALLGVKVEPPPGLTPDDEPNGDEYLWATYESYRIIDTATRKVLAESKELLHEGHLADHLTEYPAAVVQGQIEEKWRHKGGKTQRAARWATIIMPPPPKPWSGLAKDGEPVCRTKPY